jgi:ABC-2 type transport system ATP-binding protein
VDIDTPAGLVRRHCPERTVLVTTGDAAAESFLRAIAGVQVTRRDDGVLAIRGEADDLMTSVIQCLADHQTRVTDFQTVVPTLEDVFIKLTGHSIRP